MAVALLATLGITSQARASGVDPFSEKARFISVGKQNSICATLGYTAEGYMVDNSGVRIPNSTWKNWDGNIRGCDDLSTHKAVFAWTPANDKARIDLTVYAGDDVVYIQTVPGDQNFCLFIDNDQYWNARWSSTGGGGSGNCTAS